MVLEALLNPRSAEHRPLEVFALSVVLSAIALWLSMRIFPQQASIMAVMLITVFFVPFFQRVFYFEEKRDKVIAEKHLKKNFIARHDKALLVYSAFFLGVVLTYSFVFMFVPEMRPAFALQLDWFRGQGVVESAEAAAGGVTAQATDFGTSFGKYVTNNSWVMVLFFALSLLFGSGAVFVLAWNASVIAVFLGMVANTFAPSLGTGSAYVYGVSVGLASIALHGIPEITGYFFAGIAGGILSVALLREKFMSRPFKLVAKDSILWLAVGEVLIIIGAVLEAAF